MDSMRKSRKQFHDRLEASLGKNGVTYKEYKATFAVASFLIILVVAIVFNVLIRVFS